MLLQSHLTIHSQSGRCSPSTSCRSITPLVTIGEPANQVAGLTAVPQGAEMCRIGMTFAQNLRR